MADQNSRHVLRVKFGEIEFHGEGDEATVSRQYELFLDALNKRSASSAEPKKAGEDPGDGKGKAISEDLIARVFKSDGDDLSLRALPTGANRDADALVLLLWGFSKLKGLQTVWSTKLMKAATTSGLSVDRIDRVIGPNNQYVTKAGQRKWTSYGLNNPGQEYAKEMITRLLG